jgi:predicted dehydrogenase
MNNCVLGKVILNSRRPPKKYPAARTYRRFEDALADAQIDAVVISSPAELHFQMAMAALKAGKDVFVEKPMTLEPEQGAARRRKRNGAAAF